MTSTSLKEDLIIPNYRVEDQKYMAIYSVIDSINKNRIIKVLGAFDTEDNAKKHIEFVGKKKGGDIFNSYIVNMYLLSDINFNSKNNDDNSNKFNSTLNEDFNKFISKYNTERIELDKHFEESDYSQKFITGSEKKNSKVYDLPPGYFDPLDELNKDEKSECFENSEKKINIDYEKNDMARKDLFKDGETYRVHNQNWILVSYTGMNLSQKTEKDGIIFWGAFRNETRAKEHAKKLSASRLDIYMLEMYTWTLCPPNINLSQEEQENKIIYILKNYKLHVQYEKEIFNKRKYKLQNNPDINQFNRMKTVLKDIINI